MIIRVILIDDSSSDFNIDSDDGSLDFDGIEGQDDISSGSENYESAEEKKSV